MISFLKMWWMAFWRIALFAIFFIQGGIQESLIISGVVAGILRFGFGIVIETWPLKKIVQRRNPVDFRRSKKVPVRPGNKIAARVGTFDESVFSPRNLAGVSIPESRLMHGTPGFGLSDSDFGDLNISLGQAGETNFAKSLAVQNHISGKSILESVETFWSVAMPGDHNPSVPDFKFETDIDCIAVTGNTIFLIDLKFYESGGAEYTANGNVLHVNGKKTKTVTMTRNMEMAQDRFRKHYPKMNIQSRVVFVPTTERSAVLNNVYWPGMIPAINLIPMLGELSQVKNTRATRESRRASANIESLRKK